MVANLIYEFSGDVLKPLRLLDIKSWVALAGSKRWLPPLLFCTCTAGTNLASQAQIALNPSPQGSQSETSTTVAPPTAREYVLGPDDLVNIFVLDVPELSREYRVSANGEVTLPILSHPVMASGLTLSQFRDSLSQDLKTAGLVSDPHLSITVVQSRLHTVAITGAVRRPQIYSVFTQTTLLDLLSLA